MISPLRPLHSPLRSPLCSLLYSPLFLIRSPTHSFRQRMQADLTAELPDLAAEDLIQRPKT